MPRILIPLPHFLIIKEESEDRIGVETLELRREQFGALLVVAEGAMGGVAGGYESLIKIDDEGQYIRVAIGGEAKDGRETHRVIIAGFNQGVVRVSAVGGGGGREAGEVKEVFGVGRVRHFDTGLVLCSSAALCSQDHLIYTYCYICLLAESTEETFPPKIREGWDSHGVSGPE